MTKPKPTPLRELAERIAAHLRRFEKDPNGTGDYYMANAFSNGRRIAVVYISYHGSSKLTRDEATAYLAWLDAGNVGKHFTMERSK